MRLENKVCIVTGSARGLGRAIALRCAQEGAKLTVCDILECEPVAREIEANDGEVLALETDITSENDVAVMAQKTIERFGRIDVLVNNAGAIGGIEIPDFIKPVEEMVAKDWDRYLEVNIKGTFNCCKAVMSYMKKQGQGSIVNIASTAGFNGSTHFLHYSTSKGGVMTMTRGLATALGEFNINVNAVAPGVVNTEAMQALHSGGGGDQTGRQLIKKAVQPEDIAAAVVFLASDEARMITGQTLAVNAGEYLH
ncbi:MAG TPA: glucose 1-dehydrogenase [Dehalococcoidia bacterium]|nr:glucose 1-dehydrogenase [Dehalococcoidia bacterium]